MGRKKRMFYMLVPQGVLKHIDVTADGKARENKQATATDNLIEQIIPLLDEPINVLEKGVYPSDFTALVLN